MSNELALSFSSWFEVKIGAWAGKSRAAKDDVLPEPSARLKAGEGEEYFSRAWQFLVVLYALTGDGRRIGVPEFNHFLPGNPQCSGG